MSKGPLLNLSMKFSIQMVEFHKYLTGKKKEYIMSDQLLRSATSIGANIHEANYASSRADFINKMQIALKEAAEAALFTIHHSPFTIIMQTSSSSSGL